MPRDWILIAKGLDLQIPEAELQKIQGPLQSLTTQLQTLVQSLPHETEPAVVLPCAEEEEDS